MHNLILTKKEIEKGITRRRLRHSRQSQGILYTTVRARLGLSQSAMADLMGLPRYAIVNRERTKRVYTVEELVALHTLSGLTDIEWCQLLRDIAKSQ